MIYFPPQFQVIYTSSAYTVQFAVETDEPRLALEAVC